MIVVARAPERFGPYRLIKTLGAGQVCQVWEVERPGTLERGAMKLILAGDKHTKANIASLKHEYQIGKQLEHPQLISTKDFQTEPSGTYMIQELFRSTNMKELIREGVAGYAQMIDKIIREAATGLAYMHSLGWLHRDIKPDNYLVNDQGQVKLIDFNIAMRKPGLLGKLIPTKSKVQGTPSYMSPEQIRGDTIDERADVYSFGCTLHELVSGKPPFTGTSSNDLLNKHLKSRPTSLTAAAENVHPEFAKLVLKLMEKESAARPSTMQQFLADLGELKVFRPPAS